MTPQLFYIGLAVTVAIAIANIVNPWLLARRSKEVANAAEAEIARASKEDAPNRIRRSWVGLYGWPIFLIVAGIYNLARAFLGPELGQLESAIQISAGVGGILFAVMLILFLYAFFGLSDIISRLIAVLPRLSEGQRDLVGLQRDFMEEQRNHSKRLNSTTLTVVRALELIKPHLAPEQLERLDEVLAELQQSLELSEKAAEADTGDKSG